MPHLYTFILALTIFVGFQSQSIEANPLTNEEEAAYLADSLLENEPLFSPYESSWSNEQGETASEVMKRNRLQDQVKKSETVLRFGKRSRPGSDAVLRFGRAGGQRVEPMRFGRSDGKAPTLLRFGRANRPADSVLRFGRARSGDTTLRFGRK